MQLRFVFFLFVLFMQTLVLCGDDQKKLVVILSSPRSLSTVFLRMMEARGDCSILCEPGRKYREKAEEVILNAYQENQILCLKEMVTNMQDQLFKGKIEELFLEKAYFVFLVRNPHHSIVSYHKACTKFQSDYFENEWTARALDYKRSYSLYQDLLNKCRNKPTVLLVDDLISTPEETIRAMCSAIDIPFNEKCLSWSPLLQEKSYQHYDRASIADYWYKNALQSVCFIKPTEYACDSVGNPTFEEIEIEEHHELAVGFYHKSLPFYDLFKKKAERLKVLQS